MDAATWAALLGGAGGSIVSLVGLYKASKAEREQIGVQHLQMALDTQQELIEGAQQRSVAQDEKIERQSARIDEQYKQIRGLREEVAQCEATKVQQQRQIHLQQEQIDRLERQVSHLRGDSS